MASSYYKLDISSRNETGLRKLKQQGGRDLSLEYYTILEKKR
ncbi:MAG: hypothetical protein ACJZ10_00580 [Candidatus Neomarinimicrobiota bacterium]